MNEFLVSTFQYAKKKQVLTAEENLNNIMLEKYLHNFLTKKTAECALIPHALLCQLKYRKSVYTNLI